jgi:ribokinase
VVTGRLVHTGQVVVDLVMRVGAMPPVGGDVLASDFRQHAGGGFNVMAAAARSGASVVYAGNHGDGQYDALVREAMAAEGIALGHPAGPRGVGVCFVIVDGTGERTFITGPGAEGRIEPVEVREDDIVYVTGYSLLHEANCDALLAWLPRLAATVLLDPGPLAGDIPLDQILPFVDILSHNVTEAVKLSDIDVPLRVLRDGPAGCVIVRDGQRTRIPGFPVQAVDTNGAGDAHCGVLAAELLRGNDIRVAAERANAAAAISVTRYGPATAPTRAEIDALVQPIG